MQFAVQKLADSASHHTTCRTLPALPCPRITHLGRTSTSTQGFCCKNLTTRMMKLGIGEGGSAQGMSDPPSQLIGQEHQDVMG
jgi:hypothetical protein